MFERDIFPGMRKGIKTAVASTVCNNLQVLENTLKQRCVEVGMTIEETCNKKLKLITDKANK